MVGNTPLEIAVYKLGDTYYGARSNEFGYANYELHGSGPKAVTPISRTARVKSVSHRTSCCR
jgi:hypothetical protein